MPGKRSNLSSLDEKILKFLFLTNKADEKDHKSTHNIKSKFCESGRIIIKNMERLREFGLVQKRVSIKGSRTDNRWYITPAGRYCVLSKLNNHSELLKFVRQSVKADKYFPSPWITKSSWIPDNAIILDLISKRDWDPIDELMDRVRNCVDDYHYGTIIRVVRNWFAQFHGNMPSNLKPDLKVPRKSTNQVYSI